MIATVTCRRHNSRDKQQIKTLFISGVPLIISGVKLFDSNPQELDIVISIVSYGHFGKQNLKIFRLHIINVYRHSIG